MATGGFTSIRFISSGDEYFDSLVSEINQAQTEIQFESYIFDFDVVGVRVLAALAEAAKRGVSVRLLIDGIGSFASISSIQKFCRENGIQFRVYRAIPYINSIVRHFFRFLKTANRRNHRKLMIVDRARAFVASFNISKVHSEKEVGKAAWKDLALLVEGPEVTSISALANTYWKRFPFSIMKRRQRLNFERIRSTHSIASRRAAKKQLLTQMSEASKRVYILTPYFVPSRKFVRALIAIAKRKINLEIILPDRSDFLIVDLAGRHVVRRLLKYNIHVSQYTPSFMHAKAVIVDDWATLGSHNFNHRSLVHDLEIDVILKTPTELAPLENYWNHLKENSRPLTKVDIDKDSFFTRMLCRFCFWFKNWL
ncbi:MAG: phosphatidylserine/phosphatidylglycerophosphate/cardiolipin synthase family protein [Bdellovibrionaceae bacterium]|nr:phosphatidylserine/phosphatidylglycerophosphate/cardiolipin synthase family protein [Pseudobdellovibrionaceae bacterium]